jgi:hypothetical protein
VTRKTKTDARKPKKDRKLRISKETVKDLDPDSRAQKVRGGAAGTQAGDGNRIC